MYSTLFYSSYEGAEGSDVGRPHVGLPRICPRRWIHYTRFGVIRFDSVRFDSIRFGSVRFGVIQFGSVRFGVIQGVQRGVQWIGGAVDWGSII